MKTISFDFDNTLWDEENQCFIPETISLLREHLQKNRVIITTARIEKWAEEARILLQTKLNLTLEVFSAPGNPENTTETELTKSDVLVRENAIVHFDDLVDCASLQNAKNRGILVRLPPAIKTIVARMY